ncbi:hypothetical protein GCM10027416_17860 [Okibacterium endophyticum]
MLGTLLLWRMLGTLLLWRRSLSARVRLVGWLPAGARWLLGARMLRCLTGIRSLVPAGDLLPWIRLPTLRRRRRRLLARWPLLTIRRLLPGRLPRLLCRRLLTGMLLIRRRGLGRVPGLLVTPMRQRTGWHVWHDRLLRRLR